LNPHELQRAAREVFNTLTERERAELVERFELTDLGAPWSDDVLDELLGRPF
jgi:hypothetical protein